MKKIMFNDRYYLTSLVLSGEKTQTRRICPTQPKEGWQIGFPVEGQPLEKQSYCWYNPKNRDDRTSWIAPSYRVGYKVAIAESYEKAGHDRDKLLAMKRRKESPLLLRAFSGLPGWRNKMFVEARLMPNVIVIDRVRLQRLQDISDEDCIAEGITKLRDETLSYSFYDVKTGQWHDYQTPREAYAALIDTISGAGTWDRNPFVFAYDFHVEKNPNFKRLTK